MIIANDDLATTPAATPVTVNILANDTKDGVPPVTLPDLQGLPTITLPPSNGTATVNPDGTVTYTPNPGFCGTDTFEYEIEVPEPLTFVAGLGELRVAAPEGSIVDWGDGSPLETTGPGTLQHTYAMAGPHVGTVEQQPGVFNRSIGGAALLEVVSWGTVPLPGSFSFYAAAPSPNLTAVPSTAPPGVTNMDYMFYGATSFNQDISGWDTSSVTDMAYMFYGAAAFDQDLSGWCVSLIPSMPANFATNTPAWTLPKPVWGTCPPAPTYDYYVNSATGNDANDGTTPATAFATLAAAQVLATNGTRIGLARGSYWREELDLRTRENIVIAGYGDPELPLPKIDCADASEPGDFAATSGTDNVYEILWTHQLTGAAPYTARWMRAWEDGERLKYVASIALCDAEPGTFHCPAHGSLTNPVTIHIHPSDSSNPASSGKLYEFGARDAALHVGPNYDASDLHTTRNTNKDGSFLSYYNAGVARRVLASDGLIHNLWIGAGGTADGCVAYDCEPSTWRPGMNATLFITYQISSSPLTTTYRNCTAYSAHTDSVHDAFYAHTVGGANKLEAIEFIGCRTYGNGNIGAGDTNYMTVADCFVEHSADRSDFTTSVLTSAALIVDNMTILNGARGFFAGNISVTDVRFYSPGNISGGVFWSASSEVTNSTFVFPTPIYNTYNMYQYGANYGSDVFRDVAVENARWRTHCVADGHSINADDNVFWTADPAFNVFQIGTTEYNFADWKTNTGGDANSVYLTSQPTRLFPNAHLGDFAADDGVVDADGRHAGSRKHIPRPDWDALVARWKAGFIG